MLGHPITVLQILPALGAGGAEQTCAPIAAALVARGDRALVVAMDGPRRAEVESAGGEVILHDVKTKNPIKIIRNAFWLASLLKREGVSLVHARSRAPAWSAYLACRMTGVPFMTTFHAAYKFNGKLKRAYNAVMAKGVRAIAISETVATYVRESYGISDTVRVVPRGIDLAKLDPKAVSEDRRAALRLSWGVSREDKVLFVPARLSPIKGQKTVIEAMAQLRDIPNLVAIIAGDPQGREAYHAALLDRVAALGLEGRVKVVPHCSDMAAAYTLCAAVLVPSLVPEGFGRVPVEAMAMGVPVVASALGAVQETLVDGETGVLVPPEDVLAWAAAVRGVLILSAEEKARRAALARSRVESLYTEEKMVNATLAIYDEIVAEQA